MKSRKEKKEKRGPNLLQGTGQTSEGNKANDMHAPKCQKPKGPARKAEGKETEKRPVDFAFRTKGGHRGGKKETVQVERGRPGTGESKTQNGRI